MSQHEKSTRSRPNIILIYPDQMRYDSMSPSGNRIVKTPNLQRLANEGQTFDNAFSSYPLCCPFRASLLTGKQAQGHGMYQNHFPLRADQEFLAQRLTEVGYQTMYVGKWHLEGGPKPGYVPPDRRFGFQKFAGFNRGHQYRNGIFWRDTDQPYRCDRYEPDFQTDHLIDFIDGGPNRTTGQTLFRLYLLRATAPPQRYAGPLAQYVQRRRSRASARLAGRG